MTAGVTPGSIPSKYRPWEWKYCIESDWAGSSKNDLLGFQALGTNGNYSPLKNLSKITYIDPKQQPSKVKNRNIKLDFVWLQQTQKLILWNLRCYETSRISKLSPRCLRYSINLFMVLQTHRQGAFGIQELCLCGARIVTKALTVFSNFVQVTHKFSSKIESYPPKSSQMFQQT